jgi:hypothetical protein
MQPVAKQELGKNIPAATKTHVAIEELFGAVFYMRSVSCRIQYSVCTATRVEAGSNTSTVTLRVVGGDEKEVSNVRQ